MTTKVDTIFATDSSGNINVFDLRVGTALMHYKSNAIPAKCLDVLQDYVVAAECGPLIYTWLLNSQEKLQTVRMVCPGKVGCCAVSPDELYIAVSTGLSLHIWQLSNGRLLCTANSHFQPITVIRWSQDGDEIITGGEDGIVHVWKLSHLVSSYNLVNSHIEPRITLTAHSVKVTDVYVGYGGLRARLFTTSADKTCRIYDLASGKPLLTIVFDVKPLVIIVDAREVRVFVGMFDGTIKSFSLLEPPRSLEHHYEESQTNTVLSGHTKAISCLALSIDDIILVSGSADETIKLWHTNSKQLIRTIRMKGIVTNLLVRMLPDSLQTYELRPKTVIKSFQKRFDDKQDAQILEISCPIDNYEKKFNETGNEDREDVSMLNDKIDQLQRINQELYNFAKDKLLKDCGNCETDANITTRKMKPSRKKLNKS